MRSAATTSVPPTISVGCRLLRAIILQAISIEPKGAGLVPARDEGRLFVDEDWGCPFA